MLEAGALAEGPDFEPAAVDGAVPALAFCSAGFVSPGVPPGPVPLPPALACAGSGLGALVDTSVAFRSSNADGFFGPLPSEAGFPVDFELSFLFVMAAGKPLVPAEVPGDPSHGSGRVKASCLNAGGYPG